MKDVLYEIAMHCDINTIKTLKCTCHFELNEHFWKCKYEKDCVYRLPNINYWYNTYMHYVFTHNRFKNAMTMKSFYIDIHHMDMLLPYMPPDILNIIDETHNIDNHVLFVAVKNLALLYEATCYDDMFGVNFTLPLEEFKKLIYIVLWYEPDFTITNYFSK